MKFKFELLSGNGEEEVNEANNPFDVSTVFEIVNYFML
jgi:hypothetical protein